MGEDVGDDVGDDYDGEFPRDESGAGWDVCGVRGRVVGCCGGLVWGGDVAL